MTDRAASRRAVLGAGAAGVGVAAFSALSLDRALAEGADGSSSLPGGGSTSGEAAGIEPAALPPTVRGAITKTFMFANPQGFSSTTTPSPLVWNNGAYQPGGGFIDMPLDLEAGSTIKRIDVYVRRSTVGSASIRVNRASVSVTSTGSEIDTITTTSGTGIVTGGKAMTVAVVAGEQIYLESNDFGTSSGTFVGAIVTYFPAKPQLNLLSPPVRIYDSRPTFPPAVGLKTLIANGETRTIDCSTGNAVPVGAAAALVNVTVANTNGAGFVALFKNGIANPGTSTINWDHVNEVIATTTVVALDGNARLAAYANTGCSANLIIDVLGFYA